MNESSRQQITVMNEIQQDNVQQDGWGVPRAWTRNTGDVFGGARQRNLFFPKIKIGDKVLAHNVETGELGYSKVVNVYTMDNVPSYILYCEDIHGVRDRIQTIEAAENLLLLVEGKGWTRLIDLQIGDRIRSFDSDARRQSMNSEVETLQSKEVVVLGIKKTGMLRKMYSLELDSSHSYCMGDLLLWMHDGVGQEPVKQAVATMPVDELSQLGSLRICGVGGLEFVKEPGKRLLDMEYVSRGRNLCGRNKKTGELTVSKVLYQWEHRDIEKCNLFYLYNEEPHRVHMSCAQEILVKGGNWVRAMNLQSGDILESGDDLTVVEYVETLCDGEIEHEDFYAFILDGDNNFCVGENSAICLRGFRFDEDTEAEEGL
ncbi:hypothetical protein [Undibacterium sp. TJN19]|uniref:hypothetical protein n=1 Tax=Undibacterium sp. TJN19 TaxID=3413055 RepID=UPI003BF320D6